jgi:microcystin-dependent protein
VVLGNNANVGIGTPAPQAKLHVVSNGSAGQFDGNVTINGNLNVSGTASVTVANANHANTADSATSITGTVNASQITGKVASANTADTANVLASTATVAAGQINGKVSSAAIADTATSVTGSVNANQVVGLLTNASIDASKLTGSITVNSATGNIGIGSPPYSDVRLAVNGYPNQTGVYGRSGNGYGVRGDSDTASGILGLSFSGTGAFGSSFSGNGILGQSNTGNGVAGVGFSATSAGVYGKNSSGGPAGLFDGNVQINGNVTVSGQINGASNSGVPAGMMMAFGGPVANIPAGWKLCDGAVMDRTNFAALFNAIGTSWGAPDGNSFNLPDLRGMFLRGVDSGAGNDPNANSRTAAKSGGNTGDNVGTLQQGATARPGNAFITNVAGAHRHDTPVGTGAEEGNYKVATSYPYGYALTGNSPPTSVNGDHSHTVTGGGDAETRPRNAGVYWIIKVQ